MQRASTRLHGCFWEISLWIGAGLWNDFFELRFSAFVISTTLQRISRRPGPIMAHQSEQLRADGPGQPRLQCTHRCRKSSCHSCPASWPPSSFAKRRSRCCTRPT
ncbi:hypothetical protein EMIT0158MI4_110151 [Burkholderia ambifaria]